MKAIAITSRSVTIECDCKNPYFSDQTFKVFLNSRETLVTNKNVFSLFNLQPQSDYLVEIDGDSLCFTTKAESALFNVKDFNAIGDGDHDDTPAFNAAIACLPKGGTLFVPSGVYFIKPIFLKSDMTLWLDKSAYIIGSPERNDYPVLPGLIGDINLGTWQGEEVSCFASLITAYNCTNLNIIGRGVIDCNALHGDWYTDHRVMRTAWRPFGVYLNRCSNVLLQGLRVKNTPSWNIHPYFCDNVKIYDMDLTNIPSMPTTDGIDPDTCDGVDIVGVSISVGDDCIAIKSGTLDQARKYKRPCKNIVIRNCLMQNGHGGVVFGSELSGGIENVRVSQCFFDGTDRGLRIKTRRGRGRVGVTDNIILEDIVMRNVKVPFVINMYYNMGDETGHTEYVYTRKKLPIDERTPYIGSFTFKNMLCNGVCYSAGAFYGLPESPIESITLENINIEYDKTCKPGFADMQEVDTKVKNQGLYFEYVKTVTLKNVNIVSPEGEEIIAKGVENIIKDKK